MSAQRAPERELLEAIFGRALAAASPSICLPRFLDEWAPGAALVLGTGKASAAMAVAFRAAWKGPLRGMVVTRHGHGCLPGEDTGGIEVIETSHPLPDEASLRAGEALLERARNRRPGEALFFLCSGGGSALSAVPLPGISLAQKRAATDHLMRRGADIRTINCVRKHLSALKGGRLAAAARPGTVITFVISDVPGDHVADVASGPTLADETTQADALAILERFEYPRIAELEPVLRDPLLESPKPDDPAFGGDRSHIVASAKTALDAAEQALREREFEVLRLGEDLDGIASELGRAHARLAREQARAGARMAILSGGETRVLLGDKHGRGGRNLEYLAGLALELDGEPNVWALAADTDGIDGNADHAGGVVTPDTLLQGAKRGLRLDALLEQRDTHAYFSACGLLVKTGPTRTNVNDFRLIVCHP